MIEHIKFRYILSLILLSHIWICKSGAIDTSIYDYGLTFLAHSTNQDQRTTLDLTPATSLSFPEEGFTVGFDLKLRNELYTYGSVVRVINVVVLGDVVGWATAYRKRKAIQGKVAGLRIRH